MLYISQVHTGRKRRFRDQLFPTIYSSCSLYVRVTALLYIPQVHVGRKRTFKDRLQFICKSNYATVFNIGLYWKERTVRDQLFFSILNVLCTLHIRVSILLYLRQVRTRRKRRLRDQLFLSILFLLCILYIRVTMLLYLPQVHTGGKRISRGQLFLSILNSICMLQIKVTILVCLTYVHTEEHFLLPSIWFMFIMYRTDYFAVFNIGPYWKKYITAFKRGVYTVIQNIIFQVSSSIKLVSGKFISRAIRCISSSDRR